MLNRLLNLASGDLMLLRGRASVRCEGRVSVLGMDVCGRRVGIRAGKVLPFEVASDSTARLGLGRGGEYRVLRGRGRTGRAVSIWEDIADRVSGSRPGRIMLLGAMDTGKSTLAAYLSNILLADGLTVSVVDGDVGQGDLAPPGCIGAAVIRGQLLDLRDVDAEHYAFIGAISPVGVEDLVIRSMKDAVERFSSGTDVCIINTDGYIDEHGIEYKAELARILKPDLIAYLGVGAKTTLPDEFKDGVRGRRRGGGGRRVMIRAGPPGLVTKTHKEREGRRLAQYRRFLGGGRIITVGMRGKKFGVGGRLYRPVMTAKKGSSIITLGPTRFPAWFLNNTFVSLGSGGGGGGAVRGFGLLLRVTPAGIAIKTPYEGSFDSVLLSTIRLGRKMRREYQVSFRSAEETMISSGHA